MISIPQIIDYALFALVWNKLTHEFLVLVFSQAVEASRCASCSLFALHNLLYFDIVILIEEHLKKLAISLHGQVDTFLETRYLNFFVIIQCIVWMVFFPNCLQSTDEEAN